MLLKIICAALLCVQFGDVTVEGVSRVGEEELEYVGQQYIDHLEDDDDSSDDSQEDDTEDLDPIRLKRLKSRPSGHTPSLQEISRVRGAIKEMLSGNENLFTPITFNEKYDKKSLPDKRAIEEQQTERPSAYEKYTVIVRTRIDDTSEQKDTQTETLTTPTANNFEGLTEGDGKSTTLEDIEEENYPNEVDNEIIGTTANKIPSRSPPPAALGTEGAATLSEDVDSGPQPQNVQEAVSREEASSEYGEENPLPLRTTGRVITEAKTAKTTEPLTTETTQTTEVITTTKTKRTTRKTTTKFQLDVPALLEIIANLTYDYEMNLTDNLNETLLKLSVPTCETPTTTEQPRFFDYDANATGTIVAKCFVCGLEEEGIPRHAQCADAFAGDFLPLVPVDMTARGKISKYRKYCRYLDVNHYLVNASMPRSVYGRWTGGCSVRWIDLSGIYTQRSCRNRERAVTGRHYASKRMAKLEMALNKMDNGCISSPMATLVPLSRGISLYARFHACVCTGSWCNMASITKPWTALVTLIYMSVCLLM